MNAQDYITIKTMMNAALKFLENTIERAAKKISDAFSDSNEKISTSLEKSVGQNGKLLSQAVMKLENSISKIKEPVFSGEVKIDAREFKKELDEVCKEMKAVGKKMDMKPMEMGMKMVVDAMEAQNYKGVITALDELKSVMEKKEMTFPKTFKLDEEQLRSIRSGGGAISLGGAAANSQGSKFDHAAKVVGATAVQLTESTATTVNGVLVKAASTNSGIVYVGDSSAVTANTEVTTDGFPLSAGESVVIPVYKPSNLYAIASAADQKVFWASI